MKKKTPYVMCLISLTKCLIPTAVVLSEYHFESRRCTVVTNKLGKILLLSHSFVLKCMLFKVVHVPKCHEKKAYSRLEGRTSRHLDLDATLK